MPFIAVIWAGVEHEVLHRGEIGIRNSPQQLMQMQCCRSRGGYTLGARCFSSKDIMANRKVLRPWLANLHRTRALFCFVMQPDEAKASATVKHLSACFRRSTFKFACGFMLGSGFAHACEYAMSRQRVIVVVTDGTTHHMELDTPLRYVSCTHASNMEAQVK